jgi:transcriptional regulator with XRE-family HTH domain
MALTSKQLKDIRAGLVPPSGNRVAAAMDLAGLTQAALAEAIGLTQPYVSDVCRGRHSTITLDNARKFAEFFGCQIEDLFPAKSVEA